MFDENREILKFWLDEQIKILPIRIKNLKKKFTICETLKIILNMSRQHDESFIEKANKEFIPIAKAIAKKHWEKENSRLCHKIGASKFFKSDKGKIARKKTKSLRAKRIRHFELLNEEKELIKQFYIECPSGYHVDHIIPLSKGGVHKLFNLQWLKSNINLKKNSKIIPQICEYPHCRLDLEELI